MTALSQALPPRRASASASFAIEQPNQTSLDQRGRNIVHVDPHLQQHHLLQLQPVNWQYMRPKQVTDPLNEAVRAKLIKSCPYNDNGNDAEPDYTTSGSDHGIESDMRFLEEEEACADSSQDYETDSDTPAVQLFLEEQLREILERVCSTVKLEEMVLPDVRNALRMAEGKSYLRRHVMSNLRNAGYNAGICKSRWEQSNGCPAGEYEVIDVVGVGEESWAINHRLVVDIEFRAQFQIARPTAEYVRLIEQLPAVFVGDAEKLRDVIRTMCDAAKSSLRARGMEVPPWRKYRYVAAKWVGPYKRTTNAVASACNCIDERHWQLLAREFSGIAAFKGMRWHWDAAFIHQLEVHYEKAVREAKRNLKGQRQPQREQALRYDLFLSNDKCINRRKSGLSGLSRTSGLAAALAEATIDVGGDAVL